MLRVKTPQGDYLLQQLLQKRIRRACPLPPGGSGCHPALPSSLWCFSNSGGDTTGPPRLLLAAPGSHFRLTVLGALPPETQVGWHWVGSALLLPNEIVPFSNEVAIRARFPRDTRQPGDSKCLHATSKEEERQASPITPRGSAASLQCEGTSERQQKECGVFY